ncbi:site-specific integrase [Streptomyces griseofuscus]|uniref:Site-specific integrase n=1 Tax=Streptomyces griseofuscus TaxID=146922 RepID=A0A7H1Q7C6_9ACTN|nr:tyrosine-type recombinase/integrase [Streptomyces griseofuscus]QNT96206.1 site-specific integrase [Streptomyces griseofuscus]
MATIKKEDCTCPRRKKPTCSHKPYRVTYREPGGRAGKPRQVSFKKLEDAEAFAVKVERDKDLGTYINPKAGQRTFEQVWHEWVDAGTLEESSKRNYQSVYDNHYGSFFGNKPIGSISPTIILDWEADQKERGYKETGINGRKNVLSSVFNYAVAAEIIGRNPCKKANPRRRSGQQVTPVTDEDIPTMEEVLGIIAEAPKLIRAGFWAMAGCGTHPGESLALSDESMEWERSILVVDHQVSAYGCQEISGYRRGVKRGTKHRAFEQARKTPVPESIKEIFNDHIDAFGMWGDRGWFFESPRLNDRHPSYDWFLDQFKAAAKLAGTPQYTPKSFRHFFVSEAIHAQIPLFEVAAWVGHRTTRTTELVYGHLVRRAMDRGARTMHNRLGLKLEPFKGLIVPPSLTPSEDDIEDWDDVA